MRFISGMVKVPVVATLETALPEIEAMKALDITAALAGPPTCRPISP